MIVEKTTLGKITVDKMTECVNGLLIKNYNRLEMPARDQHYCLIEDSRKNYILQNDLMK